MPFPFNLLFGAMGGGAAVSASPSYPASLLTLRNDVKSRLNLPANTPMGQLGGGSGNLTQIVMSSDTTINQYINEAIAEIIRRCYPIFADYILSSVSTNKVTFQDSTQGRQARIWAVLDVAWNGVELAHTSRSALNNWTVGGMVVTGTPTFWYEIGPDSIGLYPSPVIPGELLINGMQIPALMSEDTDISPLAPDLNKLVVFLAASRLAEKHYDNPTLTTRATIWLDAAEKGIQARLLTLWIQDPDFAKSYFEPPQQPTSVLTGVMAGAGSAIQQPSS